MVYKRVRGWALGQSLPVWTSLEYPGSVGQYLLSKHWWKQLKAKWEKQSRIWWDSVVYTKEHMSKEWVPLDPQDRHLLVNKLKRSPLNPCIINWYVSFLQGRKQRVVCNSITCHWKIVYKGTTPGADPGFFLGGGALVSCSASTPINHIVFFCRIPVVLENRRSSQGGGVRTPCTLPLDPPLHPG